MKNDSKWAGISANYSSALTKKILQEQFLPVAYTSLPSHQYAHLTSPRLNRHPLSIRLYRSMHGAAHNMRAIVASLQ